MKSELPLSFLLDEIVTNVNRDLDYHINVTGNNGSGKSALSITLANKLSSVLNRSVYFVFDVEDFKNALSVRNSIIIFDEAELLFGIRESINKVGKRLNLLKLTRFYNNIYIFNSISPSKLFKELREEKIKMLLHVFYRNSEYSISSVFTVPPLLPIHSFHAYLESVFDQSYENEREYAQLVESIPFFRGYLKLSKHEISGYNEYLTLKENKTKNVLDSYINS